MHLSHLIGRFTMRGMFRETVVLGDDERADACPSEGTQRLVLIVLSGVQVGQRFVLGRGRAMIGREAAADIVIEDEGVSREHAVVANRDGSCRVEDLGSTNGVFVNGERIEATTLEPGDRVGVGATTLELRLEDDLDAEFEEQIFSAALYDGLTGAFNRAAFDRELESEVSRAIRHGTPLALLMFDLDHFKRVNDTHGHTAGDAVLREFVARLRAITRSEDYLARFGGEEFVMICTQTTTDEARTLADRALAMVSGAPFFADGVRLEVTTSAGIGQLLDLSDPSPDALIRAADTALYRAKERGRARVEA